MPSYEIEIKSLLGSKDKADTLTQKMQSDRSFKSLGAHKQLDHYFVGKNLKAVGAKLKLEIPQNILASKDFSVRTAKRDGKVIFIIKAAVDDTTSSNGTARQEFEKEINLSLDELDKTLLDRGFEYQAKWSRERQDFKYKDLSVSIDKKAG